MLHQEICYHYLPRPLSSNRGRRTSVSLLTWHNLFISIFLLISGKQPRTKAFIDRMRLAQKIKLSIDAATLRCFVDPTENLISFITTAIDGSTAGRFWRLTAGRFCYHTTLEISGIVLFRKPRASSQFFHRTTFLLLNLNKFQFLSKPLVRFKGWIFMAFT